MIVYIWANSRIIRDTEQEKLSIQMEHIMRGNGPMINLTEREDLFGRVVIGLREIGRTELLKMGYFPTMVVKC